MKVELYVIEREKGGLSAPDLSTVATCNDIERTQERAVVISCRACPFCKRAKTLLADLEAIKQHDMADASTNLVTLAPD